MKFYSQKRSFTSGEVSPLLKLREDIKRYSAGCLDLTNMVLTAQGPATRRPGTIFISDLTYHTSEGGMGTITAYRAVPFVFDKDTAYALFFVSDGTYDKIYFGYTNPSTGANGLIAHPTPSYTGEPYNITINAGFNFDCANFDYSQEKDYLYLAYSANETLTLIRAGHTSWSVAAAGLTYPTAPTTWSSGNGFPERVAFIEQRLALAASDASPQTIWLSEAGNYLNFLPPASLVATSPLALVLASGEHNKLQWLVGASKLFAGTLGDEYVISGGGNPIAYDTISARPQSNQGGLPIIPIKIDSNIIYVEHLGRSVNRMEYDYQTDSFLSSSISSLAPHLLSDKTIQNWGYQKSPHSIIWSITDSEYLLGLSYQKQHGIIGWHKHTTQGTWGDLCCIPDVYNKQTAVWMLVERTVDSSTKLYVEKMAKTYLYNDDDEDFLYLDCAKNITSPGSTTISGLGHLEGLEVDIIADGGYHAPQTVESGEIELYKEYDNVWVGLHSPSTIIPTESSPQISDGASEGRLRRVLKIAINLYKSVGFSYGKDADNLIEVPFRRVSDPTGVGLPPVSETKVVDFPAGFTRDPVVIIKQTKPLPLTVLGLTELYEITEEVR